MNLPFEKLPFSRYGNWLAVSLGQDGSPLIRDIHGGDYAAPWIFRLVFEGHLPADIAYNMEPRELSITSLKSAECRLGFVCGARDDLYLRCEGFCVTLEARPGRYDSLVSLDSGEYEYQLYGANRKIRLRASGGVEFHSCWHISESTGVSIVLDGEKGRAELALQSYRVTPEYPFSCYDDEKAAAASAFSEWKSCMSRGTDVYGAMANYVLWGNFVHADGVLKFDALYMNKLSMTNIWSWDNCFSAIALARGRPQSALEQLLAIFDHQHTSGALPDYVNDMFASYSCVKPPVYGWALKKLREQNSFFRKTAVSAMLYEKIAALTHFWLERRMFHDWGLCMYLHGNDSGWDNASIFHRGTPVCAPDLAAFLVYQMDTLAELALELGRDKDAETWKTRAGEMFAAMLRHLHTPYGFVSRNPRTGETDCEARSLINLLPLLVHYRMDEAMKTALVKQLEGFEEYYGLATEQKESRYYRKGGYWLGPLWAPVTLLFVDALYTASCHDAARRLADKFHLLPSTGLWAENFDACTGQGYDDNAFAWTAGVYLILEEYGKGLACESNNPQFK